MIRYDETASHLKRQLAKILRTQTTQKSNRINLYFKTN
jgi:hypothetical protein